MKQIQLTNGFIALVDDEDFEYLNQWKWRAMKGRTTHYAVRGTNSRKGVGYKSILMHRVIMKVRDTKIFIDHKDHNGLNNQKANLRACTASQNGANRMPRPNSSSKYLGVLYYKPRQNWLARIRKDHKTTFIGYFKNEVEAAIAYNRKAIELHGEFAKLNVIQ